MADRTLEEAGTHSAVRLDHRRLPGSVADRGLGRYFAQRRPKMTGNAPELRRRLSDKAAALASLAMFVGMIAIWSQVLGNL